MRKIIFPLAVVAGVIAFMNLLQVGSALADQAACMACKAKAQGYCASLGGKATPAVKEQCLKNYIAQYCAEKCQKKSGKDD